MSAYQCFELGNGEPPISCAMWAPDMEFLLPPAEQSAWVARLAAHAAGSGSATPNVMRRLQAGQWQSPLVTAMLMRYYAEQTLGSGWARLDAAQIGTSAATA